MRRPLPCAGPGVRVVSAAKRNAPFICDERYRPLVHLWKRNNTEGRALLAFGPWEANKEREEFSRRLKQALLRAGESSKARRAFAGVQPAALSGASGDIRRA